MNNFFKSCRRCLSPRVLIVIGVIILALLIFVPIIGVASLLVAAPLLGCTIMCGVMAFFMRGEKKTVKDLFIRLLLSKCKLFLTKLPSSPTLMSNILDILKCMREHVVNRVWQLRKEKGVTQEELAKTLGVSRQTVIAIEKGNYIPSLLLGLKIARLFKKSIEEVFTYKS